MQAAARIVKESTDDLHQLLDNSWIRQLTDCQLADWTSRGLVNSRIQPVTLRAYFSFFSHLLMFSCMCT